MSKKPSPRAIVTTAPFADRRDAGRQLAERLAGYRNRQPVVLALPRGGVPVALEIAKALDAEMDLLMVRKLSAPGNEELGMGAVVDGADPHLVLNAEVIRALRPNPEDIRREYSRQLAEIERRRRAYLGERAAVRLGGRTVIIVDDGIATGGTMRAAARGVSASDAAALIVAVPISSREAAQSLSQECDEFIALRTPEPFYAVGAHYRDFSQLSDAEVRDCLEEAASLTDGA